MTEHSRSCSATASALDFATLFTASLPDPSTLALRSTEAICSAKSSISQGNCGSFGSFPWLSASGYCTAGSMSEGHQEWTRVWARDCKFHATHQGVIKHRPNRTGDKEVSDPLVKKQFRGHPGVHATMDKAKGPWCSTCSSRRCEPWMGCCTSGCPGSQALRNLQPATQR